MGRKTATLSANDELALAELAQWAAVAVVIAGVTLLVLGYQHVLAGWLALVLGLPITGAGGALFWRTCGRTVAAKQRVKAERDKANDATHGTSDEP